MKDGRQDQFVNSVVLLVVELSYGKPDCQASKKAAKHIVAINADARLRG
ncbi:hypothetical protein CVT25_006103 [Psilocybe cyanescens]|uniref:Uncharacterized protein n=1 Tax=Psilocybe cyanescens TaxID=93625 RepID=A0A409XQM5_PSICY|nr:hypothetical protein CVT25_006103 [Psilocybe cyanescens]